MPEAELRLAMCKATVLWGRFSCLVSRFFKKKGEQASKFKNTNSFLFRCLLWLWAKKILMCSHFQLVWVCAYKWNFFFSRLCSSTYSWALSRELCHFCWEVRVVQSLRARKQEMPSRVLKALYQQGLSLSSLLQNSPCSFVPLNVQLSAQRLAWGKRLLIST